MSGHPIRSYPGAHLAYESSTGTSKDQSNKPDQSKNRTTSMATASSTTSAARLLKSKFLPKKKSSSYKKMDDDRTPAQKQADRRKAQINPEVLATVASLK
jgi:hypothetical protein